MSELSSTPGATAEPAPPATGELTPEQKKAKRNAAWTRWAGILVSAAVLIRVAAFFLPHGLADCDGSELQSSLRSAIEASSKVKLTSVSDIRTLSRSGNSAVCAMHVNVSDGAQAQITYQLDLIKGETNFHVTDVK